MDGHTLMLADAVRRDQFFLIAHACRPFAGHETWTDGTGVPWAGVALGGHVLAVTWLGQGWVFDPYLASHPDQADELAAQRGLVGQADAETHKKKLAELVGRLRLGPTAGRLLWALTQAVQADRNSIVRRPEAWFFRKAWGPCENDWPKDHRRQVVFEVLGSLASLHVAERGVEGWPPLGAATALINDVRELPDRHVQVNVGRGLLGVLDQFAHDDEESGVRTYVFPVGGAWKKGSKRKNKASSKADERPTLRKSGGTGRLVTVYLPAILGKKDVCDGFDGRQHRLLQAVVRELTRERKDATQAKDKAPRASEPAAVLPLMGDDGPDGDAGAAVDPLTPPDADVFAGDRVVGTTRKKSVTLLALSPGKKYVGFNGNKTLRGRGYKLTETGWLGRSGYADVGPFLDDLAALAGPLGLIPVGICHPSQQELGLDRLRELALTQQGRLALDAVHLRIYTESNFIARWNQLFDWDASPPKPPVPVEDPIHRLLVEMARRKVPRRRLAIGIDMDPPTLTKILNGKRRLPPELPSKAMAWLSQLEDKVPATKVPKSPAVTPAKAAHVLVGDGVLSVALSYLSRGWAALPQLPGQKKPPLKWKPFQERLPTEAEWLCWAERWPDCGIALVLGTVSKLFVIDVDGVEAEQALLGRLGGEPAVPKAISGSGAASKFHLFFRCPDVPTRAKFTPWCKTLEFRGQGGIIIAPPSLHKSGNRYRWVEGRSPDELELPEVPSQVLEALLPKANLPPCGPPPPGKPMPLPDGLDASCMTKLFLSGKYANGPDWNTKLFLAACDLAGRGRGLEDAMPLLLAGAQPWDSSEEEKAMRTIHSAYSQPREPGQW